ncbi:unnamed protein product [Brassica rapa]|uniref:Uncharacterized protein n=1 Tax=Brassica campestris TaxID=3711 RepID=A0A3P6A7I1_BRACM|nr:unnamed protein product [Brassica rapa]VDC89646.1 unnamed protein product [Brassica rapa]
MKIHVSKLFIETLKQTMFYWMMQCIQRLQILEWLNCLIQNNQV